METGYIEKDKIKRKETIETTFKDMGLRANKSLAEHILTENAYENNLLPDISKVDYTRGNSGPTELKPLEGFGVFVDDVYIFGYLKKEDIVFNRYGVVQCTTGTTGSATYILD